MGKRSDGVQKRTRGGKSRWVIDFRYEDENGRVKRFRRDARVQTRAGAEAERRRLMEIVYSTGSLETKQAAPTLRVFVRDTFEPLFGPKFRAGTWIRYQALLGQGLLDELGDKRLDAITPQLVRAFMATLARRKVQPRGAVNLLRTILRAAVEVGELGAMPSLPKAPQPGRKLPGAPSVEQIDAMLAVSDGWLRVAISIAAFAGLRQGEVRALEVRDADLEGQRILVRRALSENEPVAPKSNHERVVPLAPRLAELLAPALRGKLPAARIVVNGKGATPSRQSVYTALRNLQERHGLPHWSFHAIRHSFCSRLVQAGASVEAVRELAGHSKLHTTQRYVHASGDDLRDAINRLNAPR